MTLLYILLAIVLLGLLITVHEFGHFAAARLCGIPVKEFSIGFGPRLAQWKGKKHETVFSLRPIPLGGYCMFYGDTDDDPTGATGADPRSYNNAPVWKRMLSVFSGPLMNFVLAFAVAVVMMAAYGVNIASPLVADVTAGSPAEAAGLRAGDVFVSVAGQPMTDRTVNEVSAAIGAAGAGNAFELVISREGVEHTLAVTPAYDAAEGRYMIGIMIQQGFTHMSAGQVVPAAWNLCAEASTAVIDAIGQLFTTREGIQNVTGPVGVVQAVAEQTQRGGLEIFLYLAVLISVNLGLMNLLPIPGLDGSRLLFMLVEAIRRKPVDPRVEGMIHLAGYALLFGFMVFFTFKDVARIFG